MTVPEHITDQALLAEYARGRRDFCGVIVRAVDGSGARLPKAVLVDADFTGADFLVANLRKADFRGSILRRTILTRANVRGATFNLFGGQDHALFDFSTRWPDGPSLTRGATIDGLPLARVITRVSALGLEPTGQQVCELRLMLEAERAAMALAARRIEPFYGYGWSALGDGR